MHVQQVILTCHVLVNCNVQGVVWFCQDSAQVQFVVVNILSSYISYLSAFAQIACSFDSQCIIQAFCILFLEIIIDREAGR